MMNEPEAYERWGIAETVAYVLERGYKRITLQFPDDLLEAAPAVATALQDELKAVSDDAKVHVLADTTYNPLSVDEVAALHVNGDCVIHYGHASLTPVTRVPALCVLPRAPPLDVDAAAGALAAALAEAEADAGTSGAAAEGSEWAVVTYDLAHAHDIPRLRDALAEAYKGSLNIVFADVAPTRLDPPAPSSAAATGAAATTAGGCCGGGGGGTNGAAEACCASQPGEAGCAPAAAQQQQQQQQQQPALSPSKDTSTSTSGTGGGDGKNAAADDYVPPPLGGLVWRAPAAAAPRPPRLMIWLGPPSSPALAHLQLTHSAANWARVDPSRGCARAAGLGDGLDRLLKRRYYLVQRCKAAPILGLLVGTLGAARYRDALDALRALAATANRKAYTLLMGKPSPAKLANFPEIGAFVMVAEPQGLLLDCAEYLAPVVTPYEALLALTDAPFDAAAYRLDYGPVLEWWALHNAQQQQQRVEGEAAGSSSAAAAAAAGDDGGEAGEDTGSGGVVAALAGGLALSGCGPAGGGTVTTVGGGPGGGVTGALAVTTAAEYLAKVRTFRGLETPATGAPSKPPELAAEGRSGRAAGYDDEP